VPASAAISLLRSLVTKNATVLKFPGRDPVTCTSLALSFLDADPDHPVARATSVVYWPNGDAQGSRLVGSANGVCVWGGREALAWAKQAAGEDAELVRFGPKQSFSVVEIGSDDDARRAARGVAHDVCMYDQAACFSTLRVFVAGDRARFVERLAAELRHYDQILPPGRRNPDDEAHVSSVRLLHEVLGSAVRQADHWTIVECEPDAIETHPGARTVFVHPIASMPEAARWVDETIQTIAIHPWQRHAELRDAFARRGACRIVETGMSGILRLGMSHDGIDPGPRFVRLVAVEAGSARHTKGMAIPIDTTEMVEDRQFRELIA
jgi:long-chain-fatty-acyl-CoA reductase